MTNTSTIYSVLLEAYEHYNDTGDRHFEILPKNPNYLLNIINSVESLQRDGYISNVSDNIINNKDIHLVPLESMSFDITTAGIEYVRANRDC